MQTSRVCVLPHVPATLFSDLIILFMLDTSLVHCYFLRSVMVFQCGAFLISPHNPVYLVRF